MLSKFITEFASKLGISQQDQQIEDTSGDEKSSVPVEKLKLIK